MYNAEHDLGRYHLYHLTRFGGFFFASILSGIDTSSSGRVARADNNGLSIHVWMYVYS